MIRPYVDYFGIGTFCELPVALFAVYMVKEENNGFEQICDQGY
ncbi:MAG: hypothetical protein SOZ13_06350 [Enterococcus avium]|nr:hypothetical protein [Enterococcus avium]MDY4024690.1 hypothetical protein [Enterococcus avium]